MNLSICIVTATLLFAAQHPTMPKKTVRECLRYQITEHKPAIPCSTALTPWTRCVRTECDKTMRTAPLSYATGERRPGVDRRPSAARLTRNSAVAPRSEVDRVFSKDS